MSALRKIYSFFKHCANQSAIKLSELSQSNRFREALELYESGKVSDEDNVAGIVGYCYYQMSNFEKAVVHLQRALEISQYDHYSRLFLALSLKSLDRNDEAIKQLIKALELHPKNSGEILDHLLPLASQITDNKSYQEIFSRIHKIVSKHDASSLNMAKILFYQRRDSEIISEMLGEVEFCRIYDAKNLTDSGYGKYLSLGVPEKLRFVYLETGSDTWIDTRPPYVAEIPDATIMHNSSLVLTGKDKVLSDLLANKDYGHFVDMQYDRTVIARRNDALLIKKPTVEKEIKEIPEGIMLSGLASAAYGHWFAEFLPKLRFFEKHPRFSELPIIIDDGMPQSHYDFLSALVSNPTYRIAKGTSLKVKNLLVAPTDILFPTELVKNHTVPPEQQGSLTIGALRYISGKITERLGMPQNPSSRIFLSRRSSTWRRLVNEKEIIEDLQKLGFKTVYAEDYPFLEQVKLFREAEFIVAPNGSALNNLIFSSPNVKLLMVGQKKLFNWGGWFGSFMELGYEIIYLAGDSVGNAHEKHSDYFIPVENVREKVLHMIEA